MLSCVSARSLSVHPDDYYNQEVRYFGRIKSYEYVKMLVGDSHKRVNDYNDYKLHININFYFDLTKVW